MLSIAPPDLARPGLSRPVHAAQPLQTTHAAPAASRRLARIALPLVAAALLAACGGGGGGEVGEGSSEAPQAAHAKPQTRAEAMRFLNQATFGPTEADIQRVMAVGYVPWLDEQFARPQSLHRAYWDADDAALKASNPNSGAGTRQVHDSFYTQAVTGDDQLRQRVAYALSQVFVVSMMDSGVADNPQGVAAWLDMLGRNAFGNYRQLLEDVARHPMMGIYLSHMRNQKEDAARGRVPDENFAREVMQLFSIGLHQLEPDGTPRTDGSGQRVATYTHEDIQGLAKVFTGFSWNGPDTADGRFWGWCPDFCDANRRWMPMQGYSQFHSLSEKRFLGAAIAPQTRADPEASLRTAMDALAAHPNIGPFIGRQLIQRLVTSDPSPAYVARVAARFADNGAGVRGDMKAVVRAVLLDPEAREPARAAAPDYGKLREPVLRLTAVLRAFGATSDSGKWLISTTDDPGTALGQSPLRSPSVFNFYRPGWVAPGTQTGAAGMTVPELQTTHETTVAGYANYIRNGVSSGFGQWGVDWRARRPDVQLALAPLAAVAHRPDELVQTVATRLLPDGGNAELKAEMLAAVESVPLPAVRSDGSNQRQHDDARLNRARMAVFLGAVSPEFIVQK